MSESYPSSLGSDHDAKPDFDLAIIISRLGVSDRGWQVLNARMGLGKRYTLEEIGEELGVTRERVRQIVKTATGKILRRLRILKSPLDVIEAWSTSHLPVSVYDIRLEETLGGCQSALERAGWCMSEYVALERLIVAVRAMSVRHLDILDSHWPNSAFAFCCLLPAVRSHPLVQDLINRKRFQQKEQVRNRTYKRLALKVLSNADQPLHWTELAERAERLGYRPDFNPTVFFNTLIANPEIFARVGPGTYGLVKAGYQRVHTYVDIVAGILKVAGHALSMGDLLQRVNEERAVKSESLQFLLETNVRFYRSLDNTYGLRSWLSARSKQTLRTPNWQVEAPDSFRRVDRAEQRGSDVDRIVSQDLE